MLTYRLVGEIYKVAVEMGPAAITYTKFFRLVQAFRRRWGIHTDSKAIS
jgi:hypothetical protein